MGVEIERKFLVNHDAWAAMDKPAPKFIRQGYMVKEPAKTVRIRIADEEGYITIKGKSAGSSRSEYEYKLPLGDTMELLNDFCGEVLTKNRYEIVFAGKLWEIDEFLGDNEGLFIAEIELDDENETFEIPTWITTEVTGDKRYYNSNLSVNPYSKW